MTTVCLRNPSDDARSILSSRDQGLFASNFNTQGVCLNTLIQANKNLTRQPVEK